MPTKTFERLRDEKQEMIIRAAIHEFVQNGFTRAKTADMAKNANISKGSVFKYFENKKELFVYCAKWSLDLLMKKIDKQMNIGDMDIFEYFNDNNSKKTILQEEVEVTKFMQIVMNEPGLFDASMKSMYDIGNIYTTKLIENGKAKGTVRKDINNEMLMEFFLAVTDRFEKRWLRLYLNNLLEDVAPEDETMLYAELGQMLELLKNGMSDMRDS